MRYENNVEKDMFDSLVLHKMDLISQIKQILKNNLGWGGFFLGMLCNTSMKLFKRQVFTNLNIFEYFWVTYFFFFIMSQSYFFFF